MMDKDIAIGSAVHDVIESYMEYQESFRRYKRLAGLKPIENAHECVSGTVDKLGRLTRHVKHNGRNDPKPNFPSDAVQSFAGILAYADMIMEGLDINDQQFVEGFAAELMKGVKQHGVSNE